MDLLHYSWWILPSVFGLFLANLEFFLLTYNRLQERLSTLGKFPNVYWPAWVPPTRPFQSMEGLWDFFKHCFECDCKLPPFDSHSPCLLCLGKAYQVDTCLNCRKFSKQTPPPKKNNNHAAWLKTTLQFTLAEGDNRVCGGGTAPEFPRWHFCPWHILV